MQKEEKTEITARIIEIIFFIMRFSFLNLSNICGINRKISQCVVIVHGTMGKVFVKFNRINQLFFDVGMNDVRVTVSKVFSACYSENSVLIQQLTKSLLVSCCGC